MPILSEQGKDKRRFAIIWIYLFTAIIVGMAGCPILPILLTTMKIYNISGATVALSTCAFQVTGILASGLGLQLADSRDVQTGAIVGTILLSLGFTLRILINENFYFVILGQVLAGLGAPFIFSLQGQILNQWFLKKDRPFWLLWTSLAPSLGLVLSFLFPILFVRTQGTIDFKQEGRNLVKYLTIEAILAIASFILSVCFWAPSQKLIQPDAKDPEESQSIVEETDLAPGSEMVKLSITKASLYPERKTRLEALKLFEDINLNNWQKIKGCFKDSRLRELIILHAGTQGLYDSLHFQITATMGSFSFDEKIGPIMSISFVFGGFLSVAFLQASKSSLPVASALATIAAFVLGQSFIFHWRLGLISIMAIILGGSCTKILYEVNRKQSRQASKELIVSLLTTNTILSNLVCSIGVFLNGYYIEDSNQISGANIIMTYGGGFFIMFVWSAFVR